jgi:hypothetical protein
MSETISNEEAPIEVSVEGFIFKIAKTTLLNIPYFKNLFETIESVDNFIYVDRSAKGFSHVLRWARNEKCQLPAKYKEEYDFFLLNYNQYQLIDSERETKKLTKTLTQKLNNLDQKINELIMKQPRESSNDWTKRPKNPDSYYPFKPWGPHQVEQMNQPSLPKTWGPAKPTPLNQPPFSPFNSDHNYGRNKWDKM